MKYLLLVCLSFLHGFDLQHDTETQTCWASPANMGTGVQEIFGGGLAECS